MTLIVKMAKSWPSAWDVGWDGPMTRSNLMWLLNHAFYMDGIKNV